LNFRIFSEINLEIEDVNGPDEWALNICKALGVTSFINPVTGRKFMNKEKYARSNIELKFLQYSQPKYDKKREQFEPGLSIIDVMMFNSPQRIRQMLENYMLV
jgi:hypothetical protein